MNTTDYDVEGWFANHGLPWTTSLSEALEKWGVECVEHIKLLPRDEFLEIFDNEKFIVKETAKRVFDKLQETPFDLTRVAVKKECDVPPEGPLLPPPDVAAAPAALKTEGDIPELNIAINQAAAAAIDQANGGMTKKKQQELKSLPVSQQLETIARMWNWKGHQTNFTRLAVAEVLNQGFTKTDIAREIRLQHEEEWDGSVNSGNDKICKRIMATLVRIHTLAKSGKLDNVSPTTSKTVILGTRGNRKGAKRGPYKKKQSTYCQPEHMKPEPEQQDVEIEQPELEQHVEHNILPPLEEANIERSDIHHEVQQQDEDEQQQQVETIATNEAVQESEINV